MLLKVNEDLIINIDYIVSIQQAYTWENKYFWKVSLIDGNQCIIDENTYNYLRETQINEP